MENEEFSEDVNEAEVELVEDTPKRRGRQPKSETAPAKSATFDLPDGFPVRLLRNYRPVGKFRVFRPLFEGEPSAGERQTLPIGGDDVIDVDTGKIVEHASGDYAKVAKGTKLCMTREEARVMIEKGIAERADDVPL